MIPNRDKIQFRGRGVEATFKYRVDCSVEVMTMLSEMYSDPISAAIRELSTNASDSHAKVGNDKPFDVYLPTQDSLAFKIRDYGAGLSPDDMEVLYRTYGRSDKTDTNDQQGFMGIGSKSPFAYTTSFIAISYYEGKKYVYVNAKDDTGMPTLNRIEVCETDEPNGLEVSFAVKKQDVHNFVGAAANIYRPFGLRPNVVSHPDFKVNEYGKTIINKDNDWCIIGGQSCVVMGDVEYPINIKHFVGNPDDIKYGHIPYHHRNKYTKIIDTGILIEMPVGSIQVAPSREGLMYYPATINAIKAKLDEVYSTLKNDVPKELGKCPTLWEARLKLAEIQETEIYKLLFDKNSKFQWKKEELSSTIDFSDLDCGVYYFEKAKRGWNSTVIRRKKVDTFWVGAVKADDLKLYDGDMKVGNFVSVRRQVDSDVHKRALLFVNGDAQKIADHLGTKVDNLIKTSSLPKPPKTPRSTSKRSAKLFTPKSGGHGWPGIYWSDTTIDKDVPGVYVRVYRNEIIVDAGPEYSRIHPKTVSNALESLKTHGYTTPTVIGVDKTTCETLKKKGWKTLQEWVTETLKGKKFQKYDSNNVNINQHWVEIGKQLDSNSKFAQLVALYQKYKNKKSDDISALISVFNGAVKFKEESCKDFETMKDEVDTKYPMLDHVTWWHSGVQKDILRYIQLVDKET